MIGISINAVLDGIYAASALRRARGADVPDLLNHRHHDMLRRVARDVLARIFMALGPAVTASNVADIEADNDIITVELGFEPPHLGVLKAEFEALLTAGILAVAGIGDAAFVAGVEALRESMTPQAAVGRIVRA